MRGILLFVFVFSASAYAGDEAESFMSDDNIKLFTATIMNVTDETIDIKIIRKIKGDVSENQILTMPHLEYNSKKSSNPRADQNCLISMKDDSIVLAFQTTSTDPKTLKFLNHLTNISMNMQGKSVFERIEQYVNDGSYEAAEKRRQEDLLFEASLKYTPVPQKKYINCYKHEFGCN